MGLCSAKTRKPCPMVSTGTKMELAKTKGKTQMNPADWTVSTFLAAKPMVAEIQEKAKQKNEVSNKAKTKLPKPFSIVNPISRPTRVIKISTNTFRINSVTVRPTKTAERAIGK